MLHGIQNIVIYKVDNKEIEKVSLKPESEEQLKAKTTNTSIVTPAKDLKPKKLVFGDEPLPKKVVFDNDNVDNKIKNSADTVEQEQQSDSDRLVDLLNYFVTPPTLRKAFFKNLKPFEAAKKLPKLIDFDSKYVVGFGAASGKIEKKASSKKKDVKKTTLVNIGLKELLELNKDKIKINNRVVVDPSSKKVVNISDDEEASRLLGYHVSVVDNLNEILADNKGSKLWVPCTEFLVSKSTAEVTDAALQNIEPLVDSATLKQNIVLVFGKWKEIIFSVDEQPENKSVEELFDGRVRTIKSARVEDAILITLSKLQNVH